MSDSLRNQSGNGKVSQGEANRLMVVECQKTETGGRVAQLLRQEPARLLLTRRRELTVMLLVGTKQRQDRGQILARGQSNDRIFSFRPLHSRFKCVCLKPVSYFKP